MRRALSKDFTLKTSKALAAAPKAARRKTVESSDEGVSSLRDEHRRLTHARIAAAAEDLFKSNGYRATSIQDIARAAGTTATTFYRHFKSKAELAWIVQRELFLAVEEVTDQLDAIKTRDGLRAWLDQYMVMWQRVHRLCDAYWEATLSDSELQSHMIADTRLLTERLKSFLSRYRGERLERMRLRLTLVILTLDRVAYLADTAPGEAVLDEFADLMYAAFLAKASA